MRRIRLLAGAGAAALALGTAAIAAATPASYDAAERQSANQLLAGHATKNGLSVFGGGPPERCIESAPGRELCQWRLGKSEQGWRALAQLLETNGYINLLCEVPSDGAARKSDSCTVHPRASNRDEWRVARVAGPKGKRPANRPSAGETKTTNRQVANAWIAEAQTLVALSRLMGAAPDHCLVSPHAPELKICQWRTSAQVEGHGTLATSIGASTRKKVRMRCELPGDGSARSADSCSVEVGG